MDLASTTHITDDLDLLLDILPSSVSKRLRQHPSRGQLLEVVLDLGRCPEARFAGDFEFLSDVPVTRDELVQIVSHTSRFGKDNRAGIERTLHRISCIRNRVGDIVGLTCRVGRAVYGTIEIVRDIVESGQSLLLLGRPGVGKTTMLREMARVLADDTRKRVVVVDTSNEIAGDGDIPHSGIGHARRMQVPEADLQHAVMIEAVENHMPEVIVVDEIGTEQEAYAARTIAERGVQLVATAHGTTLENVMANPTLSDLVGGIQAVTLGDEEAKRRGSQKTVLERKAPPTFDVVIEIAAVGSLVVHHPVAQVIDQMLRGAAPEPEIRRRGEDGQVEIIAAPKPAGPAAPAGFRGVASYPVPPEQRLTDARIFPYAVSRNRLERAIADTRVGARIVRTWEEADIVLTLKGHERRDSAKLRSKIGQHVPVYVLKSNTVTQIEQFLRYHFVVPDEVTEEQAILETEVAIREILMGTFKQCELAPQAAPIRRLQHELIEQNHLRSRSKGAEPRRRVLVYKD